MDPSAPAGPGHRRSHHPAPRRRRGADGRVRLLAGSRAEPSRRVHRPDRKPAGVRRLFAKHGRVFGVAHGRPHWHCRPSHHRSGDGRRRRWGHHPGIARHLRRIDRAERADYPGRRESAHNHPQRRGQGGYLERCFDTGFQPAECKRLGVGDQRILRCDFSLPHRANRPCRYSGRGQRGRGRDPLQLDCVQCHR